MSEGKGFGKTILFGEHFIVYGLPGIASALGGSTTAQIEKSVHGFEFVDNRPETPGYKETKNDEINRQVDALLKYFKFDRQTCNFRITLSGSLVCASGVGASAALATSIARAFNEELKLGLGDEQINNAAYLAEEAGSGAPSGIDNTCSVFGCFITFEKNLAGGPNKIDLLKVKKPVEIVLANSGITQETKPVVADVKVLKEKKPEWFQGIVDEYLALYGKAVDAIKIEDWKTVGKLMDKNHALLRKITVSCKELDEMQATALKAGALGAKLTGTGRGGLLVALAPGKALQEKVAKALEKKGFPATRTSIGG